MRKPTLGRGLADLLGQAVVRPTVMPGVGEEFANLPLDLLQRGRYQPRNDMRTDTLTELAESIKAQGVVQPIVVRALEPSAGGAPGTAQRYEIIAGERRWRAAQMAGLAEIPAVIRRIPDSAAIAVALIENIQRENLNPLEEARALTRLITEFGLTHQEAADSVGRSRAGVSNLLRLLELPTEVCELVEHRSLEMGHARALLALGGRRQQIEVLHLGGAGRRRCDARPAQLRHQVHVAARLRRLENRRFVELSRGPHRQRVCLRLSVVVLILESRFVLRIFRDGGEDALDLFATFRPGQCHQAGPHRLGSAQQQFPKQP